MTPKRSLVSRELRTNYIKTRAWLTRIGIDDPTARICACLLVQGGLTTLHELAQIMKKTRPYVTKLRDDMQRSPFSACIGEDPTVGNVKKGRPITLLWTPEDLVAHVEWSWQARFQLAEMLVKKKEYWFDEADPNFYSPPEDEKNAFKTKIGFHVLLAELMGLSYPLNYLFPLIVYHSQKDELVNPHVTIRLLRKSDVFTGTRLPLNSRLKEIWENLTNMASLSNAARKRLEQHLEFENIILPELQSLPEREWFQFSMDDFRSLERALGPKLIYLQGRRDEVGFYLMTDLMDVQNWLRYKMLECNMVDFKKHHLPFLLQQYESAPRTTMPTYLEFAYSYKLEAKLENAILNAKHVLGIFFDGFPEILITTLKKLYLEKDTPQSQEDLTSKKASTTVRHPETILFYVPRRFQRLIPKNISPFREMLTMILFEDQNIRDKEQFGPFLSTNHVIFFWNDMGNASYLRFKTQFNLDFPAIYFIDPIKVIESIKSLQEVVKEIASVEGDDHEAKKGTLLLQDILEQTKVRL